MTGPVLAYLAAGNSSMLLQVVVVAIAAAGVGIATFWRYRRPAQPDVARGLRGN